MPKIAQLADIHFGCRNGSLAFSVNQEKFYRDVFFPYMADQEINHLIIYGDIFDHQKKIDFNSLYRARKFFFDPLVESGIRTWILVGNHDIYYKNTLEVNSPMLLLGEYLQEGLDVTLIQAPIMIDNHIFIPWVCESNEKEVMSLLSSVKKSEDYYVHGHFEFKGFKMYANTPEATEGMSADIFKKFRHVYSGHYHEPSTKKNVTYVGAPTEYTWSDAGCVRGFNVFDDETNTLIKIRNPYTMHNKVMIDREHTPKTLLAFLNGLGLSLKGTVLRVVVSHPMKKSTETALHEWILEQGPDTVEIIDESTDIGDLEDVTIAEELAAKPNEVLELILESEEVKIADGINEELMKKEFDEIYRLSLGVI